MKKMLLSLMAVLTMTMSAQAGFFQEEDKQLHMQVSAFFGGVGGLMCVGDRGGFGLSGWEAVLCGTAIGMIPGIIKEGIDEHQYGGWDNRDLGADAIGALLGAVGTITIWEFSSGDW